MLLTRHWSSDAVLVLGVQARLPRLAARAQIRQAVREAAAQWLSLDLEAVSLTSQPGQPPQLLLAGRAAGLSISHEDGLSLAAIHLDGPVGIDVMRVEAIDDWQVVARDYLGPQVAGQLAALPAQQRALALAQAWTAREAALKCAGLPLAEWRDNAPPCRLQPLALAAPYVATLAY